MGQKACTVWWVALWLAATLQTGGVVDDVHPRAVLADAAHGRRDVRHEELRACEVDVEDVVEERPHGEGGGGRGHLRHTWCTGGQQCT